jgi:hypothetical protein
MAFLTIGEVLSKDDNLKSLLELIDSDSAKDFENKKDGVRTALNTAFGIQADDEQVGKIFARSDDFDDEDDFDDSGEEFFADGEKDENGNWLEEDDCDSEECEACGCGMIWSEKIEDYCCFNCTY